MITFPLAHLARYRDRFVNRGDTYCLQQLTGRYQRVRQPLTDLVLAEHLLGQHTLAADSVAPDGQTRWLCFDSDASDGIATLRLVAAQLVGLGLSSALEASRRGGHLWVWWSTPQPARALRRLARVVLDLAGQDMEVYPNVDRPSIASGVAQPVRLPLGVHQASGQRYPFLDGAGHPCHRGEVAEALAWLVAQPANTTAQLQATLAALLEPIPDTSLPPAPAPMFTRPTRGDGAGGIIGWVNAQPLPQLIAHTRPEVALRRVGRGYIGWCPFHDDAAPQADGTPGTPSLYVYCDPVHGWHWRCLSSHCGAHPGRVRDAFDWLVWCTGGQGRAALAWGQALQEESG